VDNRTIINPEIQETLTTAINPQLKFLDAGTLLCDKYKIKSRLEVASGEADLYLCEYNEKIYVAKLYRRKIAIKENVINRLLQINSHFVAKLYDSSTYNGLPLEILPYYKNGSLQGKTFSFDELKRIIIPNINEGLHILHKSGIIHKDLKPSNIMLADDEKSVAIIDFGISSVMNEGDSVIVTKTGMTPEYSALETFKNLFLEESDYYSFGITLFELFNGYVPYANMSAEEIGQYTSVQRIPFPNEMPPLLVDFISALTYNDITNRANKSNPNRRWTYNEVEKWLAGENLVIPGEGVGNAGKGVMPQYSFMNEIFTDLTALVTAFAKNWEEGKRQLFRGSIATHFRSFNQELAKHCIDAEEEASQKNGKDDIIFWKLLYKLNPKLKGFYWKGQIYESIPALGREMLEHLWHKDKSQDNYYKNILSEKLLTEYVLIAAPKNELLKKTAAAIEDSYQLEINERTDLAKTFYFMAYKLSGQKLLYLDGQQFRTTGELAGYIRNQLENSFENFEQLCNKLIDYDGNLDIQLEIWLETIGKKKELENWRSLMSE
jgi:serine/threonine protein kinase